MAQEPPGSIWPWAPGLANECVTWPLMRSSAKERGARKCLADERDELGGERGARRLRRSSVMSEELGGRARRSATECGAWRLSAELGHELVLGSWGVACSAEPPERGARHISSVPAMSAELGQ